MNDNNFDRTTFVLVLGAIVLSMLFWFLFSAVRARPVESATVVEFQVIPDPQGPGLTVGDAAEILKHAMHYQPGFMSQVVAGVLHSATPGITGDQMLIEIVRIFNREARLGARGEAEIRQNPNPTEAEWWSYRHHYVKSGRMPTQILSATENAFLLVAWPTPTPTPEPLPILTGSTIERQRMDAQSLLFDPNNGTR